MRTAALIALTLLAACNREQTVPTAQENRQLDDIESMLNEAPANLEAVSTTTRTVLDARAQLTRPPATWPPLHSRDNGRSTAAYASSSVGWYGCCTRITRAKKRSALVARNG